MEGASSPKRSDNIQCYIHAVLPVKKGALTGKEYFSCMLQTESETVRAVCFQPEKQDNILQLGKAKTPVKIKNFQSKQYEGKPEVVMSKYTKITPLSQDDVNFSYSSNVSPDVPTASLSALEKFGKDQLINIKAEVAEVAAVKTINTQNQGQLKKQEVLIQDPTSYTRLVLWEQHVDALQVGKTYMMENLRLKVTKGDRYVNTAKSEPFIFNETTPFEEPLVEIDEGVLSIATSMISGEIVGMVNASKSFSCTACSKTVCAIPAKKIGQCTNESCKLMQKIHSCEAQWSLKILMKILNCLVERFT